MVDARQPEWYEPWKLVLLPVATGFALAFSYSPDGFPLLAWVALAPLGVALCDRRNSVELYVGLYLGGLAFHLIHVDWIRTSQQASWLSGPRVTQWLTQGMLLALFWPLALGIGRVFIRRSRSPMALALPLVWVLFEYSRRYYWAIFDATGYPYGQLALTQAQHERLIQIADIGGAHGVTAVIAALNGVAIDAIHWLRSRDGRACRRLVAALTSVIVLLVAVCTYGAWRLSQQVPRVGPVVCLMPSCATLATVQAKAGRKVPWVEATTALLNRRGKLADIFLWSEADYPGPIRMPAAASSSLHQGGNSHGEEKGRVQLEQFAATTEAQIVMGCSRCGDDGTNFNSVAVFDPQQGYLGSYDKVCLVPFSEFWPSWLPTIGPRSADRYAHGSRFPVFMRNAGRAGGTFHYAATICYDIGFPSVFRRFMGARNNEPVPDFFVASSCESHDDQMRLQRVLLDMARFRAIECRRAIVRNVEGGYSGVIDGNGLIIDAPSEINFTEPVIVGPIPIDERFSPYTVLGDWPLIGTFAVLFSIAGFRRLRTASRMALPFRAHEPVASTNS